MKLALAMIVKGTDEEAGMLDRALACVSPHVDGIFITSTHKRGEEPNKRINDVCAKYKANVSYFQWVNDFSKARNFNFNKVPKDFDYILWCDADDIFQNPDKIRPLIEENPRVDAFAFWYYYEVDTENNPIVIHKKTQIVRNDGCVEWVGRLHEDFQEHRSLTVKFVTGIERIHLTTVEHARENQKRNVDISKEEVQVFPDDPRVHFNLANSLFGYGKNKEARRAYLHFLKTSQSDDEKYIALQRLSAVESYLGNREESINYLFTAIGMFPEIPDAYNLIGYLYFGYNMLDKAEKYLLMGLAMKPPYHKMIVFNPRDFDYNPMMALAKIYFNKNRPDYALPMLEGCLKIYPNNKEIQRLVVEMKAETKRVEQALEVSKYIATLDGNKEKIRYHIDKLPPDLQSHPAICRIRNQYFVKTESSGKDIAYYCGETNFDWNPDLFKTKGFGGSEEAVINLAKQWADLGYNVTVFNSCGIEPVVRDGVTYKPFWHYNAKDKYDITIMWRTPRLMDHEINSSKIFIDLHDVIPEGEFNEKRLKKITKILVKTKAHRDLFPNIPDSKFEIIPNGQAFELFDVDVKKDPMLLVNTSSPDRSMDVLPRLFIEVKKQVPEAKMKWAYGFENFDKSFAADAPKMKWKKETLEMMTLAGIENLGRITQAECAKLYLEGSILAYPSDFYEIDCISVKKAQACGCVPVTTDFAAFEESNQYGVKVHSKMTKDTWVKPYQFTFGIQDEKVQKKWVEEVVNLLKNPIRTKPMREWAKIFAWDIIAKTWCELF